MLPWIRVPNTKSVSRIRSSHGHGSRKKTDLSSRSSGCERWIGSGLEAASLGRPLAPQQQPQGIDVLGEVLEVRVALDVGHDDRAHRA